MADDVERFMTTKLESAGRNLRLGLGAQAGIMGPLVSQSGSGRLGSKPIFFLFACSFVGWALLYHRWATTRKAAARNGVSKETIDAVSKSTRIVCFIAMAVYSVVLVVWIDYQLQ